MSEYSVLPDNRSRLESALELAFTDLLYASENPYPTLLDPARVKKNALPYLAQDRGVSEWNAAAPESEQRQTVTNAWKIRRLAGTRKGLILAMDSLEYDAEVTAWYEMEPKGLPYHFELVAWKRRNAGVSKDMVRRMLAHVEGAKSERDTYELILAVAVRAGLALSAVLSRSITVFDRSYVGDIVKSPAPSAHVCVAGAHCQIVATENIASGVLPDLTACIGGFLAGGAARAYLFSDFSPRAIA
ncbi:MAG: phage tail protein I [Gammaproteobacteria bacterium]|nr:phage tail protein I [Gammaproteobacteria bacterium]